MPPVSGRNRKWFIFIGLIALLLYMWQQILFYKDYKESSVKGQQLGRENRHSRDYWITTVGWVPVPQVSAGGVSVDGKAPPEDVPAETLMAKLT